MSNVEEPSPYWRAITAEHDDLADRLAIIRRREAAGEFTPIESTRERIEAMETHLRAVRELRTRYLGGSS